ncbi:PhnD/SsuA/transferrin family substrate-binding protein [Aestuariivirga sp.]|uniref:phosphate/phosphite/phosphonate ABC transporter substrate-binding protein n=1 Tax=Aestuariivirga sp. TaxID=2650926 RepID=UPI0025C59370|nr:PhnD/SsuA/transferrin family substrate-binding protein [Aestuariivirga sp.]MCA3556065.1 PhnD/SsuA/transferrin family substrate-binding protein [Aestuariivirga sp.]
MIAALQMYDWPEVREATDLWWKAVADCLGVDIALSRPDEFAMPWLRDDLLFAQTCGYPFTHALKGKVAYVGTPHYAADGCGGPNYRSIVMAREARPLEAFRGGVAAVNTPDSMSGMLALKLVFSALAEQGQFFAGAVETGGHLASLAAVQKGVADVCAIDCVCVEMARRYRPAALEGLVEAARSPAVPGLPWITGAGDVTALRSALRKTFADPSLADVREALLLSGFSELPVIAYDRITDLEAAMEEAGGLRLFDGSGLA